MTIKGRRTPNIRLTERAIFFSHVQKIEGVQQELPPFFCCCPERVYITIEKGAVSFKELMYLCKEVSVEIIEISRDSHVLIMSLNIKSKLKTGAE